eukprot:TRINITY_DN5205_c0_g1_i1.p1 TRINITY_DN5205_c0_g1~~TRINITY_DN5205_c0_g1_i1.p1  ORF type:complete len:171 (-),score=22.41 TRINITY_DN5205_c0_g1_i1:149-661(-)
MFRLKNAEGEQSCLGQAINGGLSGVVIGGVFVVFRTSLKVSVPTQILYTDPKVFFPTFFRQLGLYTGLLGAVGVTYAAVNCGVKSFRAVDDEYNSPIAAASAGLIYGARRNSLKIALLTSVSFAGIALLVEFGQKIKSGLEIAKEKEAETERKVQLYKEKKALELAHASA